MCNKQSRDVQFMDCTLIVSLRFSRTGHTTLRAFGGVCICGVFNACVCFDDCVGVLVICLTVFTVNRMCIGPCIIVIVEELETNFKLVSNTSTVFTVLLYFFITYIYSYLLLV